MKNSTAQTESSTHTADSVVDCSALIDWILFGSPSAPWADSDLHAPSLLDYEFVHTVRGIVLRGQVTESEGREAIETFRELSIERHPASSFLRAMWSFRHDISAYDASYVALAQALGSPLVTRDLRLARTARQWCDVIIPG